ncbi:MULTISPECIES: hypothetical protein [Rhodopseudomonas]|uniref:Uncharacterized protein n=1 Tax=Rhodopseudomonas palustris TaxID=1076 RepID=A0A0D7E8Y5_RHOPL|nr:MULTISPECIES: hypothetical protein [Rhodopseudomonas]KIZ37218.1 hypothetical protein OO17_23840 [Rhodopseudomonas palustris]MDF3811088.1 hypothetical protein [Rhodopseudomonas sp. BAL398]WOK19976.1 hypothetical protein RBJ75_10870 [Rhodopseudomonas sp. BAL398]
MKQSVRIAPPNSLFFLEDPAGGKSPEVEVDTRPVRIWSTRSCIIVACLCFVDGETELVASTSAADAPSAPVAFEGILDTPTGTVEVSTSEREVLLRCEVGTHFTRVRVWTDHPTEPEHIQVVFG